ncbi:MAG TPA: sigma-54-dependent Fis family transcriptional regulator [Crenotrichaceae bacterium]|nr:sigma-54-dependent Fis family transcriptional regulator [Crenotrichaceae bacterium]
MQPSIVLINSTRNSHSNKIQVILEFLGYSVILADFDNLDKQEAVQTACAFFVENDALAEKVTTGIRGQGYSQPIVLVSDHSAEHRVVNTTLSNNINTVISWPLSYSELSSTLQTLGLNQQHSPSQRRSVELFRSLSGDSQAIQQTRQLIQQVADRDVTVLILGESGTGKEVVARNLHYHSLRRHQPFVPVNCGAIPAELLESELFGHEKGAFTGALSARQGRFELAEGGTLFLDEIGDMPLAMQVKLLRVIQERTFERVGGTRTIHSDVRIIAATHRNLEQAIQEKSFREDLYYRLNVFPIEIPALRERSEDIPVLVSDLTERLDREKNISIRFTKQAMQQLQRYSWPGNVRELANVVERMAILIPDGVVDANELPEKFSKHHINNQELTNTISSSRDYDNFSVQQIKQWPDEGINLKKQLLKLEQSLIIQALDECNGVVAQAARKLKLNRTTLVEKMRKFGLDKVTE